MRFDKIIESAMKPIKHQGSTGSNRKKQNLLANYYRSDPNYPQQMTRLKKSDKGKQHVSSTSARELMSKFKIKDTNKPKKLGNTGITIRKNNRSGYSISKQ